MLKNTHYTVRSAFYMAINATQTDSCTSTIIQNFFCLTGSNTVQCEIHKYKWWDWNVLSAHGATIWRSFSSLFTPQPWPYRWKLNHSYSVLEWNRNKSTHIWSAQFNSKGTYLAALSSFSPSLRCCFTGFNFCLILVYWGKAVGTSNWLKKIIVTVLPYSILFAFKQECFPHLCLQHFYVNKAEENYKSRTKIEGYTGEVSWPCDRNLPT